MSAYSAKVVSSDETPNSTPYISPKELAHRWDCSVSTAHRITQRAALTRVNLGEGKNGLIRFLRSEVEAYEAARSFSP